MTDWSKLKVVELKEECKSRDISLSGVKLKQQYIDKLIEYEANQGDIGDSVEKEKDSSQVQLDDQASSQIQEQTQTTIPQINGHEESAEHKTEDHIEGSELEDKDINTTSQPSPRKPSLKDVRETEEENSQDQDMANTITSEVETHKTPDFRNEGESKLESGTQTPAHTSEIQPSRKSPATPSNASIPISSNTPSTEPSDEQRKRKRRSVTPEPSTEELAIKRAKGNDGTPVIIGTGIAKAIENAKPTEANGATQGTTESLDEVISDKPQAEEAIKTTSEKDSRLENVKKSTQDSQKPVQTEQTLPLSERNSEERDISPAIHPATSSLYMKNFKRPLHIPSLRNHIEKLATRNGNDDNTLVKIFYLDNIRTHGFVSFNSITAASRVRSAMHGKRYPDESLREPIFVDFIPDDCVQEWIDYETGSHGFGRSGSGKRYEVIYNENSDGIEAILQDSDSTRQPSTTILTRPNQNLPDSKPMPMGVHPDRASLIPKDEFKDQPHRTSPRPKGSTGTGFKALDELFTFTTTKPKLYFKTVPIDIASERLERIRDLRLGYSDMGKSGDEGMKRYSFENVRGREQWIDKGPEFGFGRKGQDRLMGFRGRGGGMGGYRGGFGRGDSWKGR